MVNNSIQHSKSKGKFITKRAHCCKCQTNKIIFSKFTFWAVRMHVWMHVVRIITSYHFFSRRIVGDLDALLKEHNDLLKIFKSFMHKLQKDSHAIDINPHKTPVDSTVVDLLNPFF